jgi:hypothetical protein
MPAAKTTKASAPKRKKRTYTKKVKTAKTTNDEKTVSAVEDPVNPVVATDEEPANTANTTAATETGDANKENEVPGKKKKKRNFRLYNFAPENGRAPKSGGYYASPSPQLAAKKAANRWVLPKNEFDVVHTFRMREVTNGSSKSVYEFKAKRQKLDKPKTYKRGDKEITVNSKVVIV